MQIYISTSFEIHFYEYEANPSSYFFQARRGEIDPTHEFTFHLISQVGGKISKFSSFLAFFALAKLFVPPLNEQLVAVMPNEQTRHHGGDVCEPYHAGRP